MPFFHFDRIPRQADDAFHIEYIILFSTGQPGDDRMLLHIIPERAATVHAAVDNDDVAVSRQLLQHMRKLPGVNPLVVVQCRFHRMPIHFIGLNDKNADDHAKHKPKGDREAPSAEFLPPSLSFQAKTSTHLMFVSIIKATDMP
ncbi:hypothetical protein D3C81_1174220 [compost metagenome]